MPSNSQKQLTAAPTFRPSFSNLLQHKCASSRSPGGTGACQECSDRRLKLDRRAIDQAETARHTVNEVLRSAERPLDQATRALTTPRFGHDFSKVQVGTSFIGAESGQWPGPEGNKSRGLSAEAQADRSTERVQLDAGAPERIGKIVEGSIGPSASSVGPASSASSAPMTGDTTDSSCSFSVKYENRKDIKCHEIEGHEGEVGVAAVYDITGVTATGSGCPLTLDGLNLIEFISSDGGCSGQTYVEPGGCAITADPATPRKGTLDKGCQDAYAICGPLAGFPEGECTEQYTQQAYVGMRPAETRQITFRIFNNGNSVFGLISRT